MKTSELLDVTRQLATLVRLGFPLAEGLKRADGPQWLGQLAKDLEQGDDLPQALARRPRLFSPAYRGLVEAAMASSQPAQELDRLSQWLERVEQVRCKTQAALAYPTLLLGAVTVLGAVLLLSVFPSTIVPLAQAAKMTTLANLASSRLLLLALLAIVWAGARWLLAPPVARIRRLSDQVLWARTLATLLAAGKPLPESLTMAAEVAGPELGETFRSLGEQAGQGTELARMLAGQRLHPLLVGAAQHKAEGDKLPLALFDCADLMEAELEHLHKRELALAEPRLLAGAGVVVLLVLLLAWLPVVFAGSDRWF
ncbi:MAG: type II secretion system F family protein [Candidatus Eremiobacteraeota bacterium]|nr:type II secretion system F family protein [Candidatus Eremiobacteraeota bacterium]